MLHLLRKFKITKIHTFIFGILCALFLSAGVSMLQIPNGGTGANTQQTALNNLMPQSPNTGEIAYYNGTNWTGFSGNTSGINLLSENGSGIPSWVPTGNGIGASVTWTGCTFTSNACVVGSGGSSSISISNIPMTYTNLHLQVVGNISDTSAENINLQFNGDTSADYARSYGGSATGADYDQTSISMAGFDGVDGPNPPGAISFDILNYTNTSFYKILFINAAQWNGTGSADIYIMNGTWMSTSAITSLQITEAGSGNFVQGTAIEIYATD